MMQCRMDVINLLQCDPGFATPVRVMDYPYFLYVHQGTGVFKIGSVSYKAKLGDLYYCPAGTENAIVADQTNPFLLSGIEFTYQGSQPLELPVCTNLVEEPFLIRCIREMVEEYRLGQKDSGALCDNLLSVLLLQLARKAGRQPQNGVDAVRKILEYIQQHYQQPITHAQMSEQFCYHKNSINRMMLRATGMTLKNYVINLRLKKACELLRYSGKSAAEIAEQCGYSSSVFFSRQFREKIGMTPLDYRRKNQMSRKDESL